MIDNLLFISGGEIFFVFAIALLLFGSKAIPDIARVLGKGVREFKKATNEIKRELEDNSGGLKKDIDNITRSVKDEAKELKDNITKDFED
ncbi:twin-arginine translocase TatA/TatE family subunit [Puteibacter caeruleilacunae]|nr:twin-arginine translocase TatA/TatE family subunit [Puteibacter caeruleilacunae]